LFPESRKVKDPRRPYGCHQPSADRPRWNCLPRSCRSSALDPSASKSATTTHPGEHCWNFRPSDRAPWRGERDGECVMKGVFYEAVGKLDVRELPDPTILDPTDVIVRIVATTVCGSDVHIAQGHMFPETGFAIGHEYVGVITEVGAAVRRFEIGDRVVGPPAAWCGECDRCRRGQRQVCQRGGIFGSGQTMGGLGGAQATLLRVPWADQDLTAVPDSVSDAAALAVADILTTGWTGINESWNRPGGTVLVLGCGPVGLSAVHIAKRLFGASKVIAADIVPERLELAKRLGADETLLSGPEVVENVFKFTNGRGADSVVDAAGMEATLDIAGQSVAIGGKIAVLGVASKPITLNLAAMQLRNPTIWLGLGDLTASGPLMEAVEKGILDPLPMFNEECALEDVPAIYQRLAAGDLRTVKTLVRP